MTRLAPALILVALANCTCAHPSPLADLSTADRSDKMARDGAALKHLIGGLERVLARADKAGIFRVAEAPEAAVRRRAQVSQVFAAYIDHALSLDRIRALYDGRGELTDDERAEAFLLAFAADMALYLNTAALLRHTAGRREFEVLLDAGDPEQGIPEGAWEYVKEQFNRHPWQRPLILAKAHHETLKLRYRDAGIEGRHPWLFAYVDRNWDRVLIKGAVTSPKVAIMGGADLLREGFVRVWFPAQKGVAEWMGDTKVRRKHGSLIRAEQVAALRAELRPGDILIQRRNWYLSNVGLPGFWPHAALFLGTPDEATAHLGIDGVRRIAQQQPEAFSAWKRGEDHGDPVRVIEAISEGVSFTSLEHSAVADYLAVLRPRLPPTAVVQAIARAFAYQGRPYDFEFDFLTDDSLVCTELVYKAYEAPPGQRGLSFDLVEVLGRPTLPANALIAQFDREQAEDWRQLDFVAFLDGREESGDAIVADLESLRGSHRRPKWDFLQR